MSHSMTMIDRMLYADLLQDFESKVREMLGSDVWEFSREDLIEIIDQVDGELYHEKGGDNA